MSTKTPPPPKKSKDSNPNAAAAELRALRAKKEKERDVKRIASKGSKPRKKKETALVVLPPIEPADGDIKTIIKKRVTMSDDRTALTLSDDTTLPEYLRIFDDVCDTADKSQWLLGAIINEGMRIYSSIYVDTMARTGRSISTLKKYAYVERNIAPELRPLADFSHCEIAAKIPKESDKRELLQSVADAVAKGQTITVKEFAEKAKKFGVRKPKQGAPAHKAKKAKVGKDKPDLEMNALEKEMYDELEEIVIRLDRCIEGVPFILDMSSTQTATLREKLERIARFYTQIS